jgi:hypothetical protein
MKYLIGFILAACCLTAAGDTIVLSDGSVSRGTVTSFSNGVFTVEGRYGHKDLDVSSVNEIAFDDSVEGATDSVESETKTSAVAPRQPNNPTPGISRTPPKELKLSITEFNAKKADLVGSIAKIEFLYRGDIDSLEKGRYRVYLDDDSATMWIEFGRDGCDDINCIKTAACRWSNDALAKRSYYLYGKIVASGDRYGDVEFSPLGKSKKGSTYSW